MINDYLLHEKEKLEEKILRFEAFSKLNSNIINTLDVESTIEEARTELDRINKLIDSEREKDALFIEPLATTNIQEELLVEELQDSVKQADAVMEAAVPTLDELNNREDDLIGLAEDLIGATSVNLDTVDKTDFESLRKAFELEAAKEKMHHPFRFMISNLVSSCKELSEARQLVYENKDLANSKIKKVAEAATATLNSAYSNLMRPVQSLSFETIKTFAKDTVTALDEALASVITKVHESDIGRKVDEITFKLAQCSMSPAINPVFTAAWILGKESDLNKNIVRGHYTRKINSLNKLLSKHPESKAINAAIAVECDRQMYAENVLRDKRNVDDKLNTLLRKADFLIADLKQTLSDNVNSLSADLCFKAATAATKEARKIDAVKEKLEKTSLRIARAQTELNNELSQILEVPPAKPTVLKEDIDNACKKIYDEIDLIKTLAPSQADAKMLIDKREKLIKKVEKELEKDAKDYANYVNKVRNTSLRNNTIEAKVNDVKADINIVKLKGADLLFNFLENITSSAYNKSIEAASKISETGKIKEVKFEKDYLKPDMTPGKEDISLD